MGPQSRFAIFSVSLLLTCILFSACSAAGQEIAGGTPAQATAAQAAAPSENKASQSPANQTGALILVS
jgi:starvation-inducible outer membrane lipoprotein